MPKKLKSNFKKLVSAFKFGKNHGTFAVLLALGLLCFFLPKNATAQTQPTDQGQPCMITQNGVQVQNPQATNPCRNPYGGTEYALDQIQLKFDTQTQGPNNTFVNNNLIQAWSTSTSANVNAVFTIASPGGGLKLGTDHADTVNTTANGGSFIKQLGAAFDDLKPGSNPPAGNSCYQAHMSLFSFWIIIGQTYSFDYITCGDFSDAQKQLIQNGSDPSLFGRNLRDSRAWTSQTPPANTPFLQPLVVQFSDFPSLDKNNTTSPQPIVIYPYYVIVRAGGDRVVTFDKSFLTLYVQFYPTQADAQQAIDSGTRPGTVPAYQGAATSTPTTSNSSNNLILALINTIIGFLLSLLEELVYALFFYLIAPLIAAMLSIHAYTDTFVAVIYPGWEIIRNICNIFFIIALMVIALATLFRLEAYQFKHLLIQLIIGALLINFSLVLGQAVLGVADTVQAQFLPNNVETVRSLAQNLMVQNQSIFRAGNSFWQAGTFTTTIQQFFWLALSIGSFAVFCAIAAYLVIRMVMLWMLLMVSPVAYAAGALPATAKYRGEWWQYFLKYAFFTPIMAFFLNMAALMANNFKTNGVLSNTLTTLSGLSGSGSTANDLSTFVFRVTSSVLLLVFLIASLKVAEQAGIYGAAGINKIANKGIFGTFKIAKVAGERAFEGVQNITGVTLDPRIWAAKYKEYSEREKQKRLEKRADTDIGLGGKFKIKGSAKYGLGSPLDFYKNFANWQGVKRMARTMQMSTKRAFGEMRKQKDFLDDLRQQGNILTDKDRGDLQIEFEKAKIAYSTMFAEAEKALSEKNDFEEELGKLEAAEEAGTLAKPDEDKRRMQALRSKISEREKALSKMGASKFTEDPVTGREKLLEDFEQDTELKEAQVKRQELEARTEADDAKLADYREKIGNPTYARQNQSARDNLANALKRSADSYNKAQQAYYSRKLPEAYHARAARQHLEAEEEKKVSDIKSWPEKVQVFLSAQAENNPYLGAATIKSLAKDSNFNEIVEALGYSSSAEGLKQFFEKEYREKFGLSNHQMMQVATEVGYMNEDAGWWNMARVSDIDKHGHVNWQVDTDMKGKWAAYVRQKLGRSITEDDLLKYEANDQVIDSATGKSEYDLKWSPQIAETSAEMDKRGARLIANFARTSFVNQTLGPEGHMTTAIHGAGLNVLQSMSKTSNTIYEFSRMLRPNTAKAIASAKEWDWSYCKKNKIDREIYEKITKMAGKPLDRL